MLFKIKKKGNWKRMLIKIIGNWFRIFKIIKKNYKSVLLDNVILK